MERIDKLIASQGQYSRKEVKALIAKERVAVDGTPVKSSSDKADPAVMQITIDGKPLDFKRHVYLMLNKPQGYVSATEDRDHQTVLELVPEAYRGRDLFPAGRLDRDTTGLMIITDDGALAHNILAPKKHVPKLYRVELDIPVTEEMRERFLAGVVLNDGVCKAADLTKIDTRIALVTLREGRYHQIKRMFGCCGAAVVALKRLGMGKLYLPEDLAEGECRELTAEELAPFALRVSCYRIMQKLCDAFHTVLPKLMEGTQKRTVPAPGTIRSSLIFCAARLAFLREKELHSPFEV